MSLSSYLSLSLKVDWNNDGDFSDTGEDVSAYGRYPLRTTRGRSKVTDDFGAGTGSFALANSDGRFTPLYASSPLYPNVLPGRPIQVQATYNATTYPVFRGRCTPDAQRSGISDPPEMSFTMADAFEQLRLGLTNTSLLQGKRVDEVITAILDDIGWPAGDRALDTGPDTLTVFTNHNRLPLNALQLAARQDPGGCVFMSRDGKVTYQNRYNRASQPVYATLAGTFEGLDPQLRQEDVVSAVRATYPRFAVSAALSAVFTLQLPRRLAAASSGSFDFEVNASQVVGATGYVTPLVATTDYVANTQADGSGVSKTAQVTLTVSASSSGGGTISWTNADAADVYLTMLQVRAYPLQAGGETNAVRKTVASPVVSGQELQQDYEFLDNVDVVTGWVKRQTAVRGSFRIRPVVTIVPDTDALMAIVLGAEIGKRVAITDTAAPWLTQANGDFYIEGIDMEFTGPASVKAAWRLFDAEMAGGTLFRISGPAGAGHDWSKVAGATSTSGYDRIAY